MTVDIGLEARMKDTLEKLKAIHGTAEITVCEALYTMVKGDEFTPDMYDIEAGDILAVLHSFDEIEQFVDDFYWSLVAYWEDGNDTLLLAVE